jgi:uncharacterized damage-inducible protein DinB
MLIPDPTGNVSPDRRHGDRRSQNGQNRPSTNFLQSGHPMRRRNRRAGSGSMSRGDILLHVVNHTIYHHGHTADMIYQIPASPPATDLPVFLRDVPLALP